jgi:aspartate/methionine/tyrosine aminotransferase
VVGPPDEPGPGATKAGDREIEGHTLLVTGHRPPELGGYGETPTAIALRARLAEIFRAKLELNPDLVVVTALGLGAEMLAAEAAEASGVPFVAVLAHPGIDDPWPEETRRRFRRLVGVASDVITLSHRTPENRPRAAASYARRDAWLRRNADEAVVVWNGTDALVGKAYRSVVDVVGEDEVWLLDPDSVS